MKLFGKRKLWYLTKFAKFQYRISRGDCLQSFFFGKIKAIFYGVVGLATSEIVIEGYFGISVIEHLPWWVLVLLPIVSTITDYYLGLLDEKKIHLMQIEKEIQMRRKIDPWELEKMKRIKNIEKKVSPETAEFKHKSYIVGEKENEIE